MEDDDPGTGLDWTWLNDAGRVDLVAALEIDALTINEVLLILARLACLVTGASCSQISLIGDLQVVPVAHGFEADPSARTPAEESLCSVTVASGAPFAVADALEHPWVRGLPPVASGGLRSYLGAPVFASSGQPIGAICAFGPDPHDWSAREMEAMVELAELVGHEIRSLGQGAS